MPSIDDYQLRADGEGPPPDDTSRSGLWVVVAALLVIAAIVAAVVIFRPGPEPDEATVAPEGSPAPTDRERLPTLGADAEPLDLPPLDLTDPVVRELLGALSSRPEMVRWLATDNLLRRGVAAIDNVARGQTPATHFRAVAPAEKYSAEPRANGVLTTSRRAYARYDGIAQTVATLDAEGIAKAYTALKPRMVEAYRELGYPEGDIDAAVHRALVHLLQTPDIAPDEPVEASPLMYKYSDPRIEGLSAAQKQLLRMGPENARQVKAKLREIAIALGIPEDRLPKT